MSFTFNCNLVNAFLLKRMKTVLEFKVSFDAFWWAGLKPFSSKLCDSASGAEEAFAIINSSMHAVELRMRHRESFCAVEKETKLELERFYAY